MPGRNRILLVLQFVRQTSQASRRTKRNAQKRMGSQEIQCSVLSSGNRGYVAANELWPNLIREWQLANRGLRTTFSKLVHEFVPMLSCHLISFKKVKAGPCGFVSPKAWLWDNHLSSNPKAWGVRIALVCGIGEKGTQNPDFVPLSLPSGNRGYGTEESGCLSGTSDSRSVSTCNRDLSP